jgi:hypothetical protein
MASSSYMLERELLGSARSIIDAHSNLPLTQPTQHNTYRSPYGITNQLPYTNTLTTSYNNIGYGNISTDNYESKKALNDVNRFLIFRRKQKIIIIIYYFFSYKIKFVY